MIDVRGRPFRYWLKRLRRQCCLLSRGHQRDNGAEDMGADSFSASSVPRAEVLQPMLLVQGFQRAFVELGNPAFSVSAAMRRSTCEQVLKFARASGWTIVHSYLETNSSSLQAAALDGFTPLRGELYAKQETLSAFCTPMLAAWASQHVSAPIYLISFAGVGAIGATFFDAMERDLPFHVVTNAIADAGRSEISERLSLAALDAMATSFNRAVRWPDLASLGQGTLGSTILPLPSTAKCQRKPLEDVIQDLAGLLLMAQHMLDEAPALVERPTEMSQQLETIIIGLEEALECAQAEKQRRHSH